MCHPTVYKLLDLHAEAEKKNMLSAESKILDETERTAVSIR